MERGVGTNYWVLTSCETQLVWLWKQAEVFQAEPVLVSSGLNRHLVFFSLSGLACCTRGKKKTQQTPNLCGWREAQVNTIASET